MPDQAQRQRARELARTIRGVRREEHLSQQELADLTGLGLRTIKEWEAARVAKPHPHSIRTFAEKVGRPLELFIPPAAVVVAAPFIVQLAA